MDMRGNRVFHPLVKRECADCRIFSHLNICSCAITCLLLGVLAMIDTYLQNKGTEGEKENGTCVNDIGFGVATLVQLQATTVDVGKDHLPRCLS
jgi:hypothetical protein